ncbi:MAG: S8 family serine peptidase [Saprospiraceae bacterium]
MLTTLYPISYFASLLGLILWFYYKDNRKMSAMMSKLFLGGFFVYTFSLAFSEADFSQKLLVLCRDLFVLGLVSQGFNFFRKHKLVFFGMLFLLFGVFGFSYKSYMVNSLMENQTAQTYGHLDKKGEFLVELSESHQLKEMEALIQQYDLKLTPAFSMKQKNITELDDYFVVNVPDQYEEALAAIELALQNSGVLDWVEPNEVVQLDPSETVSALKSKRNYKINDPQVEQLWGFDAMKMDQLYSLLSQKNIKPNRKAKIFILDTGVDATHEDLAANYQSVKSKYDRDGQGHGTHCAGIAGAVSNNKKGIASFSNNNEFVTISSIKVLNNFGGGTQKTIVSGILEAADNGADVISMSLGGPSMGRPQRAYQKAIDYANKAGAIVVVAAGNSNANAKDYVPASLNNVITVAAIDEAMDRASFSNYISDVKMGIAAPGVNIYSTLPGNKYAAQSGTSMATPYVAGLVGLLKSIKPELTTKEVYQVLNQSGQQSKTPKATGAIIQPAAAVKAILK